MGIDSTEGNGEEWSGDGGPPEPSRGEMALERGRGTRGRSKWVWGGGNHPCPRLNPLAPPLSGSTVVIGGSTAPAVVPRLHSGSTAQRNSKLDSTPMAQKEKKGNDGKKREPTQSNKSTSKRTRTTHLYTRGRWPRPPMFESIGMAPRRIILGPMTKTRL